jgi:sigma-B regulation protein RsbU (phosphoserine phosphatase)
MRAAAIRSRKPSVILTVLNEALLRQDDERFCTVAYARLRPRHHGGIRMALASGGHPLPLRVRRGGAVDTIGRTGPLIGVLDTVQFFDLRFDLAPGELVIFYTDGVTEARRGSEQFGEARLSALVRDQVGADPESVADLIEDAVLAFQGGHAADDFCVIALRVTGDTTALA